MSMKERLLPLFPLEVVLFPNEILPLHIFEDRYKQMIGECLDSASEFGVVCVREGKVGDGRLHGASYRSGPTLRRRPS